MDVELTVTKRPPGRVGRAAARYRSARAEIEPLMTLLFDLAGLGALLYRHFTRAGTRTEAGGEG
ncbi:MAG: hypothetical protein ACYDDZ_00035 [Acidimicrobiales bacterium]